MKFSKDRFQVISKEKQQQVLDAAMEEFAANGFNGTSINKVAARAKISIGALYSYFDSKEDLFLTIIESIHELLEEAYTSINKEQGFFDILKELYGSTYEYVTRYHKLNQIYLDLSTQSLTGLAERMTKPLEAITKEFYAEILAIGQAEGVVRKDIPVEMLCLILDDLGVTFQFSNSSCYYQERMKLFLTDERNREINQQIAYRLSFVKRALRPE